MTNPFVPEIRRLLFLRARGAQGGEALQLRAELERKVQVHATHPVASAVRVFLGLLDGGAPDQDIMRAGNHLQISMDDRAEKMVSDVYGYIWVCVPKVASRSIINYLRSVDPGVKMVKGKSLGRLLKERPKYSSYFKFAFCRNPYLRAYSAYKDKVAGSLDERPVRYFYERLYGIYPEMQFEEFIDWLLGPFGVKEISDRHFLPQRYQLIDEKGHLAVDYTGKIEQLDLNLEAVSKRIGLPSGKVPSLNRTSSSRGRKGLDEIFTNSVLEKLYLTYKVDFEELGYNKDSLLA